MHNDFLCNFLYLPAKLTINFSCAAAVCRVGSCLILAHVYDIPVVVTALCNVIVSEECTYIGGVALLPIPRVLASITRPANTRHGYEQHFILAEYLPGYSDTRLK